MLFCAGRKRRYGMVKKVSCLGPEGSYTHIAACNMCCGASLILCRTFFDAVNKVLSGEADAAVLPIENTINGGVLQNLDILAGRQELTAVAEYTLKIDHRLITLAGADKDKITRIYSHRQALDQCAGFLNANYPNAELIAENSTAASISCIKSVADAAIAGVQCAREGFDVSSECISDEKNNYTHFLLVVKGALPDNFRSKKVYFTLTCNHVPGALLKLLSVIYKYDVNMTKIESRPIKGRVGEYRFFIEIEADYAQEKIKRVLGELEAAASSFRVIGAY